MRCAEACATSSAIAFSSNSATSNPTENVFSFGPTVARPSAVTIDESIPPLRKLATGTSERRCCSTAVSRSERIFCGAASLGESNLFWLGQDRQTSGPGGDSVEPGMTDGCVRDLLPSGRRIEPHQLQWSWRGRPEGHECRNKEADLRDKRPIADRRSIEAEVIVEPGPLRTFTSGGETDTLLHPPCNRAA